MQTHPIPLADHFAALKQSTAELGAAHALVLALLVRLLDGLVALARRWQAPPRRRRHPLAGKGPIPRDWMVRCQPGRGFRPSFPAPVLRTPAHLLRTPPEPAGSSAARALSPQT